MVKGEPNCEFTGKRLSAQAVEVQRALGIEERQPRRDNTGRDTTTGVRLGGREHGISYEWISVMGKWRKSTPAVLELGRLRQEDGAGLGTVPNALLVPMPWFMVFSSVPVQPMKPGSVTTSSDNSF